MRRRARGRAAENVRLAYIVGKSGRQGASAGQRQSEKPAAGRRSLGLRGGWANASQLAPSANPTCPLTTTTSDPLLFAARRPHRRPRRSHRLASVHFSLFLASSSISLSCMARSASFLGNTAPALSL
ncbi:hypothetical protein PYCCODRAFT_274289 [Trametes coccinea BRFM310]|uniref:Uncharacterized protein n=1 Tax=Trametes coccinea (strain BRFM310) TaxID=1353009 RepID=A0A1Y2IQG0_TRAC3|nr:hypothetical protein PYCCODRAFT_274289 [Trametes coccinea BRFM310]